MSGSVLVMAATLRLKVVEVVEEAVTMVVAAVVVVERLVVVAAAAAAAVGGKAVMAELEALKGKGKTSWGKVVVGIDAEVKGEDAGVDLLEGAEVASYLTKAVAVVGDCQTVEVEVEGLKMVGVVGVVWKTAVEAGVLTVGEVGARDLRSKRMDFWDLRAQAVRLWKSWTTSLKRPFH